MMEIIQCNLTSDEEKTQPEMLSVWHWRSIDPLADLELGQLGHEALGRLEPAPAAHPEGEEDPFGKVKGQDSG